MVVVAFRGFGGCGARRQKRRSAFFWKATTTSLWWLLASSSSSSSSSSAATKVIGQTTALVSRTLPTRSKTQAPYQFRFLSGSSSVFHVKRKVRYHHHHHPSLWLVSSRQSLATVTTIMPPRVLAQQQQQQQQKRRGTSLSSTNNNHQDETTATTMGGIMMILSPAKTLNLEPILSTNSTTNNNNNIPESSLWTLPHANFRDQSRQVAQAMKKRSPSELVKLLSISTNLANVAHKVSLFCSVLLNKVNVERKRVKCYYRCACVYTAVGV